MFTWIPFYTELARKLLPYRNRQQELVSFLRDLKSSGVPTISLTDYTAQNTEAPLAVMDPFTFFASFNRGITSQNRIAHADAIKRFLQIESPLPDDFEGIPIMDNQRSWYFAYGQSRESDDISILWDIADEFVSKDLDSVDPAKFSRALDVQQVAIAKLTIGAFWMNPGRFLPADSKTVAYVRSKGIQITPSDCVTYREWVRAATQAMGNQYPQISRAAHINMTALDAAQAEVPAIRQPQSPLGSPFDRIFDSAEEANWAFDFIGKTLADLGVTNAKDDKRISLTLTDRGTGPRIRLNFGNWAILTFLCREDGVDRLEYICRESLLPASSTARPGENKFSGAIGGQNFMLACGPVDPMRDPAGSESQALSQSLKLVAIRFSTWSSSNFRKFHRPELLEMIFDLDRRKERLRTGLNPDQDDATHWIFQGNPQYFDLDTYLSTRTSITWQARQYANQITAGDKVLIWRSGEDGGVIAVCEVEVPPDITIPDDAPELFREHPPTAANVPNFRSRLRVLRQFVDRPIPRSAIKAALPDLGIIRQANATNYRISPSDFDTILALNLPTTTDAAPADPRLPASKNLILYGPPGTGKTHKLRSHYMEVFTERKAQASPEERAITLVQDLAWWEVIALALLDATDHRATVAQILEHPLVQARLKLSVNKNPRAMIWASLQTHTKADCSTVKYANRIEPLLFAKDDQSVWSVDASLAATEVPALPETLKNYRTPPAQPESVIRRYQFITFHQSFSYEDFIEGIKPKLEGEADGQIAYEVRDGIFKKICAEAKANPTKPYALFIDEINRGNISSIFGELITLIEDDKRLEAPNSLTARLPYSQKDFGVPANLYLIGTMNTADRSVEALDTALRRRFIFEELRPDPAQITQPAGLAVDLRRLLTTINARLERLLDHDHCIGHAYFMGIESLADLQRVFANKILPLLREYFYGNPAKIGLVLGARFIFNQGSQADFAKGDWGLDDIDAKTVYQFADVSKLSATDFASIYA